MFFNICFFGSPVLESFTLSFLDCCRIACFLVVYHFFSLFVPLPSYVLFIFPCCLASSCALSFFIFLIADVYLLFYCHLRLVLSFPVAFARLFSHFFVFSAHIVVLVHSYLCCYILCLFVISFPVLPILLWYLSFCFIYISS